MASTYSMTSENQVNNDQHLIAQVLREAIPYIDFLKEKTLVIKLGGSTLENQRSVLQDIIWLQALGARPVLVHGGGPYINEWLDKLNMPTHFQNGLRVTDASTLDVVRMVLLGQVNAGLVLLASQLGGKAIGLSGTDGKMIYARIADKSLGFVGEIESVDPTLVQMLIDQGYIPVIAPLGQSADGDCLNILSNVVGICRRDGSLISELNEVEAQQLIEEGVITGGMIPKVFACLDALLAVPNVHIVDGREAHVLLRELFTDQGAGTMIVRKKQ